jgi:hypothetical protein
VNFDKLLEIASKSQRIERKVSLHPGQYIYLKNSIKCMNFKKAFEDRDISSIYYDDHNLNSVRDNIDGIEKRVKFRLRFYNGNLNKVYKEVKIKSGFIGYKIVDEIDSSKFKSISSIVKNKSHFFQEYTPSILRPRCIVSYSRSYFYGTNGIRLTVDSKIKSSRILNSSKFASKYHQYDVIEFKYDIDKDSYFREVIFPKFQKFNVRMTKSSKYVRGITG